MNVTGLIVEYNPFHNGHAYHLQTAQKNTQSDITIAIMSGHFLQRGEPALVPKWVRTQMALQSGIDLVVELPYAYATQKAETFANGAVSLLHALGTTDLVFGSEAGEISNFQQLVTIEKENHALYEQQVATYMKEGLSYPQALAQSYKSISSSLPIDVHQPNNILGLHYVKAIQLYKSTMNPHTIQRIHSHYHDESLNETSIASATGIRKTLFQHHNKFSAIEQVLPPYSLSLLKEYWDNYHTLHTWELYFPLLKHKILTLSVEALRQHYEMEEGIEHRFKKYILKSNTFHELMTHMKTKRYTWTRIQRMCLHLLTGATKEDFSHVPADQHVPYIRLLGMSSNGQRYLHSIKKECPLPIISTLKQLTHPLGKLDHSASFTYAYPLATSTQNDYIKNDLFHTPIISKNLY